MGEPLVRFPLAREAEPGALTAALRDHVWYHRIGLGDDLVTPGVERYEAFQRPVLERLRRAPLAEARVLDVGCRDGLFAFEAERLGAAEVVGIDNNLSPGAVEVLVPALGSAVRFTEMNLLDATPEALGGRFDVVLFAGVLYHLREPFAGLRRVADLLVEGGTLVVETAVLLDDERWAMLWCPTGFDGPYDATSPTFFNRKGLVDSLRSVGVEVTDLSRTGAAERHPRGWRGRLRGARRIDRATLVGTRRRSLIDPTLDAYFHGTHETRRWS